MNKVLKEKIQIKHICFRKIKFKQDQQPFQDFFQTITNMNGLYLESYSVCKCELSIQLRLKYNGKRRLFVLCGEKSQLEDDEDEEKDNDLNEREEDNVLLEEGANYDDYPEILNNDIEEEIFEMDEKKNDGDYNPFINLPNNMNNFCDFYFIYFNYFDYTDGIFYGKINISHLYKYFIFLKKNCNARIILNMMKEIPDNSEEIRELLSVCSITIFYDKNVLYQLLNKLRLAEDNIKKEQEYFKHYYEKKIKEKEKNEYFSFEAKREQFIQYLKSRKGRESYQLSDDDKSFLTLNKSHNKALYSMKVSQSQKRMRKNENKEKEEEKVIVIKKNKYLPPLSKVDIFNYYKAGICDKDPLKSKEQKIVIVLDDFYKIYMVQFNPGLEKPSILDFELRLYPQINVHNIPIVKDCKDFIRDNFERYIIIFLGYLLSSLVFSGGGGNSWEEEISLFLGYYGACKVLRSIILFEKNGMPLPDDDNFFYPNLNKYEVKELIEHAANKKKENKFILDCNNKNAMKVNIYNPLLDKHAFSYLNKNNNKNFLKRKGYINEKGVIQYDPIYKDSLLVNKNEKKIVDEQNLFQTCRNFKKKHNFKMKEEECLNRYKNKNDKLYKFIVGFKTKRPEYEMYLKSIKYNKKLPLLFKKNRSLKTMNAYSPDTKKSFSLTKKIKKMI
jgi:hypothetical protein